MLPTSEDDGDLFLLLLEPSTRTESCEETIIGVLDLSRGADCPMPEGLSIGDNHVVSGRTPSSEDEAAVLVLGGFETVHFILATLARALAAMLELSKDPNV